MPMRARAWLGSSARSVSSKLNFPALGLRMPMMVFMSVVLPAPLRPIKPIIEPVGSSSDTPRRMCTAAMETLRFSTLSTVAHHVSLDVRICERDGRRRIGDDAAVIEGEHALCGAADRLHVLLVEEDGSAHGAHR